MGWGKLHRERISGNVGNIRLFRLSPAVRVRVSVPAKDARLRRRAHDGGRALVGQKLVQVRLDGLRRQMAVRGECGRVSGGYLCRRTAFRRHACGCHKSNRGAVNRMQGDRRGLCDRAGISGGRRVTCTRARLGAGGR